MGEDLAAEGRMSVRTPMQWTSGKNGGFSTAPASRLIQRVTPGAYGPEHVNVADQLHDPDSLWSWIHRLITVRRSCPEFGWGEYTVLEHDGGNGVMAHRIDAEGAAVLAVHNFTPDNVRIRVPVGRVQGAADGQRPEVVELLHQEPVSLEDGHLELPLSGFGTCWFRLKPAGQLSLP